MNLIYVLTSRSKFRHQAKAVVSGPIPERTLCERRVTAVLADHKAFAYIPRCWKCRKVAEA